MNVLAKVQALSHTDRVWPDEGRDSFGVVTRKERLEL